MPQDAAAASPLMHFDREYALVDCSLEFRELLLEGSPLAGLALCITLFCSQTPMMRQPVVVHVQ
jgi:hypothetical protein